MSQFFLHIPSLLTEAELKAIDEHTSNAIFVDGNPSGIKGLLSVLDVCAEHVRLPLTSVNRSAMNRFETIMKG